MERARPSSSPSGRTPRSSPWPTAHGRAGCTTAARSATAPTRAAPRPRGRRSRRPLGGVDLVNLGFGGSALLDPFVARVIRDTGADLISLKIGINLVNTDLMRRRAFVPAVHGFLDTIRDGHPDTPLLVVSPIACPIHEDTPGPSEMDLARPGRRAAPVPRPIGDPAEIARRQAHAPGDPRGAGRHRASSARRTTRTSATSTAWSCTARRTRPSGRSRTTCTRTRRPSGSIGERFARLVFGDEGFFGGGQR